MEYEYGTDLLKSVSVSTTSVTFIEVTSFVTLLVLEVLSLVVDTCLWVSGIQIY